ncbi:MAG TPA: DUF2344 domain-containing protein, partial [Anaerolineales bacterium]|nr:DUF2344 domain-containing protein [Anaerolineales bacterium]
EELETLCRRLNAALPPGIRVLDIREIDEGAPAVQTQVLYADYEVEVSGPINLDLLQGQVDALLATEQLPRKRREREYDLRPLIENLSLRKTTEGTGAILDMRLKAQEGATGRPDEVLLALGIGRESAHIKRTALHFKDQRAAEFSNTG